MDPNGIKNVRLKGVDKWVTLFVNVLEWILLEFGNERWMESGANFLNKIFVLLLNRYKPLELRSIPPKEGGDDTNMIRVLVGSYDEEASGPGLVIRETDSVGEKAWQLSINSLTKEQVKFFSTSGPVFTWELSLNEILTKARSRWKILLHCDAVHLRTAPQRDYILVMELETATQWTDVERRTKVSDFKLRRSALLDCDAVAVGTAFNVVNFSIV